MRLVKRKKRERLALAPNKGIGVDRIMTGVERQSGGHTSSWSPNSEGVGMKGCTKKQVER